MLVYDNRMRCPRCEFEYAYDGVTCRHCPPDPPRADTDQNEDDYREPGVPPAEPWPPRLQPLRGPTEPFP